MRVENKLSRQRLGKIIGVSHQQLDKYERGINKISMGRLMLIAKELGSTMDYFCSDFASDVNNIGPEFILTEHKQCQNMCSETARNFIKIRNSQIQRAVNNLVKALAKSA